MIFYILLIVFAIILFQDLKYRGIHWLLFPALLTASLFFSKENLSIEIALYNLGFLLVLLLTLTLYLSLRNRKLIIVTKGFFSWGDILFLVAIIPLFDLQTYMLFFTAGTFLALILHLLASILKPQKTLPYAGYMAVAGILFIVFEHSIQKLTQFL